MLFDTDVLIWTFRGNPRAVQAVQNESQRLISVVTYIELLQVVRSKTEWHAMKNFLSDLGFQVLPLTENIGHRACVYVEEYGLRAGVGLTDSLIAASATENGVALCTGDAKHYGPIAGLQLTVFKP